MRASKLFEILKKKYLKHALKLIKSIRVPYNGRQMGKRHSMYDFLQHSMLLMKNSILHNIVSTKSTV